MAGRHTKRTASPTRPSRVAIASEGYFPYQIPAITELAKDAGFAVELGDAPDRRTFRHPDGDSVAVKTSMNNRVLEATINGVAVEGRIRDKVRDYFRDYGVPT